MGQGSGLVVVVGQEVTVSSPEGWERGAMVEGWNGDMVAVRWLAGDGVECVPEAWVVA